MIEKRQPYRNPKILEAARGEVCTLQSADCNHNTETTVFAHLNNAFAGKGFGQKADDCAGMFCCSACHSLYDTNKIPASDDWTILRAYYRTIRRLIEKGVL